MSKIGLSRIILQFGEIWNLKGKIHLQRVLGIFVLEIQAKLLVIDKDSSESRV